jgi:uncharacterized DUF497 family protein
MQIIWDENKNHKLMTDRGISFEIFADIIISKKYIDILENPSRPNQMIFICTYNKYTYSVPFILDKDQNIVLKTVYPSRKYHKLYGGKSYESKT